MTAPALEERTSDSFDASPEPTRVLTRLPVDVAVPAAAAVLMAVALAVANRSGLWLDEAQGVTIAERPLGQMFDALKRDGAPPLYYVLLHGWMKVFGSGDLAVRAMSAVAAVATVPVMMAAAKHTLGRRAVPAAGVVVATLPFLYRYGTEARMYSLVVLLGALAWVFAARNWLVPVAAMSGLLLLTHYWAFFFVATAVLFCAWQRRWPLAAAFAAGGVLFVPWVPTFLFQSANTGAPWAAPARIDLWERAIAGFANGGTGRLTLLGLSYVALAVLAVRHSRIGRDLAALYGIPLIIGFAASSLTKAAFAERYAAIVVVPFVLLVTAGVRHVGGRRASAASLAVVAALGLFHAGRAVYAQRTQAPQIASVLEAQAGREDRVVFCPDQLGPSVMRELEDPPATSAYPEGDDGELVDWVDYRDRNRAADPKAFAEQVHGSTAGTVWVVAQPGYRTFGRQCTALVEELRRLRPGDERAVKSKRSSYERASLWRFAPVS